MKKIILLFGILLPLLVHAIDFPCICSPVEAGTINVLNNTVGNFTVEANPNDGYSFVQWKIIDRNGNVKQTSTNNPFHVQYKYINAYYSVDDSFFNKAVAYFKKSSYVIYTSATNGAVTGGGSYDYGSAATLTVTPNACYEFSQWSDGNTDNPRTITVTGNATYTAEFEQIQYTIEALSADAGQGSATVTNP